MWKYTKQTKTQSSPLLDFLIASLPTVNGVFTFPLLKLTSGSQVTIARAMTPFLSHLISDHKNWDGIEGFS